MRVGVGYSDTPDSQAAGIQAAEKAMSQAGMEKPCDLVLLFSTSKHDVETLTEAIALVFGKGVPIIGGGAVGCMDAREYGYAGDQMALAAFWFGDVEWNILSEPGLKAGEEETGRRLGNKLAAQGVTQDTSMLLLYDAIDRSDGGMRLLMATPLLHGVRDSLGFMPNLVGAGLQGDYASTPIQQWNGKGLTEHEAVALAFGDALRIDSTILHGCRPATGYYTVTKSEQQVVLEINGTPAIPFIEKLLGPAIPPDEYPFFLTFGINKGDPWGEFDDEAYANRLCLAIDPERNGIVMFEPDMVAGTRFQLMHRAVDLDYIIPKIKSLFADVNGRKPVFALYINCAGRAAGAAGTDLEDAEAVQKMVADVPFLGIYSGVEIAPVRGDSRALDWTGVFCLFSVANE